MRPRLFRLLSIFTISLALAWTPVVAVAQEELPEGGGGDNTVVAINTKDGSSEFKVSFRIVRTSSDVVDESNIAVAFASCEACETVAIAFQVVLVSGSPSVVLPENYAIALNFECISCETLASAYQFVLGVDGQVHFSPAGNRALAEIRQAIRDVARSELSVDQIQAELDLLADDLRTVLADEIAMSGADDVQVQQIDEPASPAPTPAPSASPTGVEPSPSPSLEPSPSPSPSSAQTSTPGTSPSPATSPAPTASASPSPSPTQSASVTP
jgi:putative peptide zinc metalloprotease protein